MRTAVTAGALLALVIPLSSLAGPSDYVASPIVEEGEREIDIKAGTSTLRDGTRLQAESIGFGWGATSWWFTELYAKWHKERGIAHGFDAWEWENKFQLTETGKYPVDVGLLLEIERPKDRSEGYEVRWGPLLQADLTRHVQANLNLLLEKHVHVDDGGPAELGYQWQLKYRWKPAFEFGAQGFGNLGAWDHWNAASQQEHVAGPAVFGRVVAGEHRAIRYNAALLVGLNNASPKHTLRMQAEFEF